MLSHGAVLHKNGFSVEAIQAILQDYRQAGLEKAEVDMMDLATRMSKDPQTVTPADIQRLRDDGFSDADITDIALAAALRNFMSRFLDSLGAEADPELVEKEPELWGLIQTF